MDAILKQKIANPSMKLYDPHNGSLSPTSQLIDAIIDLITTEDYSHQVCWVSAFPYVNWYILYIYTGVDQLCQECIYRRREYLTTKTLFME